jgi:hypothetical protein
MKGIPCQAGEREAGGQRLGAGEYGTTGAGQSRVRIAIPTTPAAEGMSQLVFARLLRPFQSEPPIRSRRPPEHSAELVFSCAVMVN